MQQQQYIDHFRIERALGSDAHGAIYLGVDERQERTVAIKTLKNPAAPADRQALAKEAKAASALRHPNIVELYDFGTWQGGSYFVFEHVVGETLEARIKGDPLPVDKGLQVICDVLDGLSHAHKAGIVHGDIKPANITFDSDDNPRVMDFGLWPGARNRDGDTDVAHTERYSAPEVVTGEDATVRSDIYSLGLVMFEILTGRHPVGDALVSPDSTVQKKIPLPSTLCPELDDRVDAIVMRALAHAPAERFPSAGEMGEAIYAYLQNALRPDTKSGRDAPTFAHVLRKLQRNKDFPAFAGHIAEINRLTSSESNATIVDLTNTVLKDLSLTNKLLRLVNSSMYCQFGGKITTVSRAITIVGFENIRTLAVGLLLFDQVRNHPNARELLEVNLWSFMAAGIARSLADTATNVDAEQTFISALLARFGTLLAIYYLPQEYSEICRLMEEDGVDQSTASCTVLGLNLHTLGRMIAEHLHFPRLLIESMQAPSEEPEQAPHDAGQATLQIAGFAAQVGDIFSQPGDQRDVALRELSQKYDAALDIEEDHLYELIDQNLHAALDLIEMPKEWAHDAEAGLRSLRSRSDLEVQSDDVPQEPEELASEPGSSSDVLLTGIDEITNMLIDGQALNDVLGAILEIAFRTLEMQRVVMFVNDVRTRQVAARFGIGDIDATLLKKLKFSLSELNPVHGAIERGEDVLIENSPAAHDRLPDWCRRHARAATCAMLPIVVKQTLIGIIYADVAAAHDIDAEQFQHLKTLRNQAALAVSVQRKR